MARGIRPYALCHWSWAKVVSTWQDTLSVLVARVRAQVGVHSAKTDWSRRIVRLPTTVALRWPRGLVGSLQFDPIVQSTTT